MEDLTRLFTKRELREFRRAWDEATDPSKQLTREQALKRSLKDLGSGGRRIRAVSDELGLKGKDDLPPGWTGDNDED